MSQDPMAVDQLALVRSQVRPPSTTGVTPAINLPVARVAVDVSLPHLDRPFDYAVPESLSADAVPGCRVKVRFAGRDVAGFVLDRVEASDHLGRLTPIRRVVSAEPVLTPQVAQMCRLVADRYAGTFADVVRLAVPPRHARVEKELPPTPADRRDDAEHDAEDAAVEPDGGWGAYRDGSTWLAALATGSSPRAVWTAVPGEDWPLLVATAVAACATSGRGSLVVVPDRRDVDRVDHALTKVLGGAQHVVLTADQGPTRRYRAFLAAARGQVKVVLGTRAAALAPVEDLGLVVIWDDGDDVHSEQRAPYPHARETLLLRAHTVGAGALLGAFGRSVESHHLVTTGWARALTADRETVRRRAPRIVVAGDSEFELARDPAARSARLPRDALRVARAALTRGPVLIQVPRAGYALALACQRCRAGARCASCSGPLRQPAASAPPACGWCGLTTPDWRCPECDGQRLRAPVIGSTRTADELGRAFPSIPIRTAGGDHVVPSVPDEPALVVATPGAEPIAAGGYAAALLLDAWVLLARPDLRTAEESLRRWLTAAALVRPASDGGEVVIVGEPSARPIQALIRLDPAGLAERELADRTAALLPPVTRLATIDGPPDAVQGLIERLELPGGAVVSAPELVAAADHDTSVRAVVRAPRIAGPALAQALKAGLAALSARKLRIPTVRVDPISLG